MARRVTSAAASAALSGFPDRVRSLIGAESQAAFAERAGISQAGLSGVLRGAVPGLDVVIAIAKAGNVSVGWLAAGERPALPTGELVVAPENEKPLNQDILRVVVQTIEDFLQEQRRSLAAAKKAEVIALCYAIAMADNDRARRQDTINRLLELAV